MVFAPALAMACLHALSWLLWVTAALMGILFLRQWLIDGVTPLPMHLVWGTLIFAALGFGARLLSAAVKRMMDRQDQ
jgi:hypothetical protein